MTLILLPTPPSSARDKSQKNGKAIATPFCPTKLVSRRYANGSGGERMPFPSPPGLMRCLGIVAPTADYWLAPRTDLITSDIPEPNKMPYTIHENCIVVLTVPPLIEDAGDTTKRAVNTQEADPLHATPAAGDNKSEEVEPHFQSKGMSAEKNKENCQVKSMEAKPGSLEYLKDHSCHVSEGNQMPDLSQCHEYDDNSEAFADWKGSSRPSCAKSGPPPYLRGHPSGPSGSEG